MRAVLAAGAITLLLILAAFIWRSHSSTALNDVALRYRGHLQHAAHHAKANYLFTLDAHSGTLTPHGGGRYRLDLANVHENALYFTDRPDRQVGTVDPQRLFAGLLDDGQVPPNLAINALNPKTGHQDVMGVTLISAKYDPAAHTASLEVRALPQGPAARREHNLTDVVLPKKLKHTSLFIDSSSQHTCTVTFMNVTSTTLNFESASKWDTDSWYGASPDPSWGLYPGPAPGTTYETQGGIFRGCGNTTEWSGTSPIDGSSLQVTFSASDPWSGSNQYSCEVDSSVSDGDFRCGLDAGSESIGGDDLNVQVDICSNAEVYAFGDYNGGGGLRCAYFADGMNWLD